MYTFAFSTQEKSMSNLIRVKAKYNEGYEKNWNGDIQIPFWDPELCSDVS